MRSSKVKSSQVKGKKRKMLCVLSVVALLVGAVSGDSCNHVGSNPINICMEQSSGSQQFMCDGGSAKLMVYTATDCTGNSTAGSVSTYSSITECGASKNCDYALVKSETFASTDCSGSVTASSVLGYVVNTCISSFEYKCSDSKMETCACGSTCGDTVTGSCTATSSTGIKTSVIKCTGGVSQASTVVALLFAVLVSSINF